MYMTKSLLAAAVFGTALFSTTAATADVNVPGLACQAPFLDQAFPMRWHEHYVLNPIGNQKTWVVCPLSFESTAIPQNFAVAVFGMKQPGTQEFPRCFVNFIDLTNQHLPGVVDNPGQKHLAQALMSNTDPQGQRWISFINANVQGVTSAVASNCGPACWTISVNCELPPGYAVQMVSLIGTN